MVQANIIKMAFYDEIKAAIFEYLYKQSDHSAYGAQLYKVADQIKSPVSLSVIGMLNCMCDNGELRRLIGSRQAWYRLTVAKWLEMKRSKQPC